MKLHEHVGVLHVHSRYSDGTGTVEEILQAARAAGLDHVVLTDHDTLAAAREGYAGNHDGVQLVVATEITPKKQGHVLALRVDHCEGYAAAAPTPKVLDAVAAQRGYAIVAHPLGKHRLSLGINQQAWAEWSHPTVRGLEIWSYTHDWVDGVTWWRLPMAYSFWRHPGQRVRGPYRTVLAMWDKLGRTRRLAGWAGLDCHARKVPLTGWKVFDYQRMFGFLRNHLYIEADAFAADPQGAIWTALAEGSGFLAHDALADSTGTRCGCLMPDGTMLNLGAEGKFQPGTVMSIALPEPGEIRWIQDGSVRLSITGTRLYAEPAGPGVYRFEVLRRGRPWIYTNAVYLR